MSDSAFPHCSIHYRVISILFRLPVLWIHLRMENRHFAFNLKLHEWVKDSIFDIHVHEGLPEINTILIKMQSSAIEINKNSYYCSYLERLFLRLPRHPFNVVIGSPSLLVKLVTGSAIYAPNVFLSWKILIDQEVLPTNADAYLRVELFVLVQLIYPILEVKFILLNPVREVTDVSSVLHILIRILIDVNALLRDHSAL